jgi:hypothetical protein
MIMVGRIGELGTLAHLFYHSDDGGYTFLRNVGSYKSYTALQSRRQHSS